MDIAADTLLALPESERRRALGLLRRRNELRAQSDLGVYAQTCMGIEPARHHALLIDELHMVEAGITNILIVMMPPGSAKSTYGSIALPAWYLGRHPTRCVIAASHTGEMADKFGRRTRNFISTAEHQAVFPACRLSADSTAAGRWELLAGGEYFAAGVGGAITGRRADLAIIDDPIRSREDADSEVIREKHWNWWRDDLSTRLKPNAAVVLIMTRWHEDDLAGRIIEDLKDQPGRVRVVSLPMEAMADDPLGRAPGEQLWPEWFTPQMVADAKREPRTWTSLYQQQPRPIGGGEFQDSWLLYYARPPAASNRVLIVDPASGKSKTRGDYTSMWVVGCGQDGNYFVLDGVRDRLNLTARTDAVFEMVRKWKPHAVGYESYGLQADIEHIQIEQESKQYRFRIVELGGQIKKEDRIRRLIPLFEGGRIWMPRVMHKTAVAGHSYDVIADFKTEYSAFPVGAHDDAIDCLARIVDPAMAKYLVAPKPPANSERVSGWAPLDPDMGY